MKIKSLIVVVSLILSSCASTFQYNKIAQPNSNDKEMATIYVLRRSSFGSAIKFWIYQDEKLIGKLGPKSYLAWTVKPDGKDLTIMSKSENKDMLTINPQAGKTYYIKQKVKMGIAIARTGLEFIEENEGKEILRKLKAPKSKYTE
ncbi:MAG: DUF2846 domain-containing protein [Bacteroidetes bacterium]|nr:DUF2846 domain-containing protein [Bacteroidota bacterium]